MGGRCGARARTKLRIWKAPHMSRNLGDTSCAICHSDVALTGAAHAITREEAGVYFDEYVGMIVADAECPRCAAKYLAWIKRKSWTRDDRDTRLFVDLSFRHSFDDEPAAEDLPTPETLQQIHIQQWTARTLRVITKAHEEIATARAEAKAAVAGPSQWEVYRRPPTSASAPVKCPRCWFTPCRRMFQCREPVA